MLKSTFFSKNRKFSFFEKYSPVGSPSEIADWLKPFIESGAKDLNIAPIASSPKETITLKKVQKWAAVQVVKAFLGMPFIPGK